MIGIFDSGVGGLTAVKAFGALAPDWDILYLGDTARVPYGGKSRAVIDRYAAEARRFFAARNVDAILVACGTVSSNSLSIFEENYQKPVVGVVKAAAEKAYRAAAAKNGVIAVLGTRATIRSGAYEKEIAKHGGDVTVISRPCPLLVPLAENGRTAFHDTLAHLVVGEYLEDIAPQKPAAVILGCTHYPLFTEILSALLPESELVDSGKEAALSLCRTLGAAGINPGNGKNRTFYVTDAPENFAETARNFLGEDISGNIMKVNME